MEHAVSDRLIDRIDAFLAFPQFDPHGDPIPRADGTLETQANQTLAQCPAGFRFRVARVVDQSPTFLRFLTEAGLPLGTRGEVLINRLDAEVMTIAANGQTTELGREAAQSILVSASEHAPGASRSRLRAAE